MHWTKVEIYGSIPRPRHSHCSCTLGAKMVIYGGLNETNFCSTDLYVLELDMSYAEQLKNDQHLKMLRMRQASQIEDDPISQIRLKATEDFSIADYQRTRNQLNEIHQKINKPEKTEEEFKEINEETFETDPFDKIESLLKKPNEENPEDKSPLKNKQRPMLDIQKAKDRESLFVQEIIREEHEHDSDMPTPKEEKKEKIIKLSSTNLENCEKIMGR